MLRWLFLFLLVLTPCVASEGDIPLRPYYESYMSVVNQHCDKYQYRNILGLTIQFGDLAKQGYAGVTKSMQITLFKTFTVGYEEIITIDEHTWNWADENERVALMYHELTHAYFGYPDLREDKDAHNFMYYTTRFISEQDVNSQLNELLVGICHK
jgi:hypothetical protein